LENDPPDIKGYVTKMMVIEGWFYQRYLANNPSARDQLGRQRSSVLPILNWKINRL